MELTILMPCLNEVETLGACIARARKLIDNNNIDGEILISDNGSTDGSQEIALENGARVVKCPTKGYGAALQWGIEHAQGDYILMGDSDDSYHFDEALPMIQKLREGFDVCMGTRLKGKIMPDAMPFLNKHLGNPILTGLGNFLFKAKISDFYCGMRAYKKDLALRIDLQTTGMEWACEHVIKSIFAGVRMTEVPVTLYKDGRSRPPHLRPWRDGWRTLRFMLVHAPTGLFVVPGLLLILTGIIFGGFLIAGPVKFGKANFDIHTLLVMYSIIIVGTQAVFTGLFVNLYEHLVGILPLNKNFVKIVKFLSLEKLLIFAIAIGMVGASLFGYSFWEWYSKDYPPLDARVMMRQIIPSLTLLTLSAQCMINGFMISTLFLATKGKPIVSSNWE